MILEYKNEEDDEVPLMQNIFVRYYPKIIIPSISDVTENDIILLLTGIPSKIENIIEGNDIQDSLEFLMKLSATPDLQKADGLLDPAFISALSKIILDDASFSFYILPFMKNLWESSDEMSRIFFDENLIESFCSYLLLPYDLRSFVFDTLSTLLQVVPNELNESVLHIIIDHDLFDSLNDFFQHVEEDTDSHLLIANALNFISTLTLNPYLDPAYYSTLLKVVLPFLVNENLSSCRLISSKIVHQIIVELNAGECLSSIPDGFDTIIQLHFLNDQEMFQALYEIDTSLWKIIEFKNQFLDDNQFIRNIALILKNTEKNIFLKPLFVFLINVMPDIWMRLYTSSEYFDNCDSISIIQILIEQAQESIAANKMYPALCIAAFILNASYDIKKEIASNEGLEIILDATPTIDCSNISFLKLMLDALFDILSNFQDLIQSNIESIVDILSQIESNTDENIVKCYDLLNEVIIKSIKNL